MKVAELLPETDPRYCNRFGAIRVKFVRKWFDVSLSQSDINELMFLYTAWRDTVEFMPLRLTYKEDKVIYAPDINTTGELYSQYLLKNNIRNDMYKDYVFFSGEVSKWVLKKSCKRGNDVYTNIVNDKFKTLLKSDKNKTFFSTVVNKKRKRVRKTKLLYLTGTCDPEKVGDLCNAWVMFGLYWNSFITNIREQFNGCEYVRAWQSQENGYPHFHALIYFDDFDFTAVRWTEKDGRISWRVHNKQKHNGVLVRDRLKNAWKWGNLDVQCCGNTRKALTDLLKYITRDLEGGESVLTNTMVWYYGKQSYSLSKGFTGLFAPDITLAQPGNDDLINAEGVIQRSNSKAELIRIEVFPLVPRNILDFSYTKDVLDPWKIPDPPPKVVDFLDIYADGCRPSKMYKNEEGIEVIVYSRGDFDL